MSMPTPLAGQATIGRIMTVGDAAPNGYRMAGIPDGLGAFDNGDGTFTAELVEGGQLLAMHIPPGEFK